MDSQIKDKGGRAITKKKVNKTKTNCTEKPRCSFVAMITMAILQSPHKRLRTREVIDFIYETFPYYRERFPAWVSTVTRTLSFNDCFIKVPTPNANHCGGNYWILDPNSKDMFENGTLLALYRCRGL